MIIIFSFNKSHNPDQNMTVGYVLATSFFFPKRMKSGKRFSSGDSIFCKISDVSQDMSLQISISRSLTFYILRSSFLIESW